MIKLFPWGYVWLCYLTTHCVTEIISLVFLEQSSRFETKDQLPPTLPSLQPQFPQPFNVQTRFNHRPVPDGYNSSGQVFPRNTSFLPRQQNCTVLQCLLAGVRNKFHIFACSVLGPSWKQQKGYITQPEDRAMSQTVSRRLCHGSGSQSAVVPWLRQSAVVPWLGQSSAVVMAQAVSLRLCHGWGSQSAVVMAQAVSRRLCHGSCSRRLCHGSGGRSAVVPWLNQSVGCCAMARAVSRRPCHGSGSKLSVAHRQCVWDLCWTKRQRVAVSLYFSTAGQYRSTCAIYLFWAQYCSYQKDKRSRVGTFRGSEELSKVRAH
jgi:hypothetical protein